MKSTRPIRIGSRQSALAIAQTQLVLNCIDFNTETLIVPIISSGDKIAGRLADHGGKSLFTKELDQALLDNQVDLAVHSMKDVETPLPEGLMIAAVPKREDPRDILIYQPQLDFGSFPLNTTIGTSSLRRACQLNWHLNNIQIVPCRGNIQTRLQKYGDEQMGGIVLAMAGLKRMDLFDNGKIAGLDAQTQILDVAQYVPAPGQGALVVVKRREDHRFDAALERLNHPPSRMAIDFERQVVEGLNVTCHDPIGVYAQILGDELQLRVMLFDKNAPTTKAPISMVMNAELTKAKTSIERLVLEIKKACELEKRR